MANDMIGIIGGTGLYSIEGMKITEKRELDTPFGRPSSPIALGEMGSTRVAFLPRHGEHHTILPSEINFRANIWALKSVGVRRIISVSATGSLQEEIRPGELALASQYFDWTKGKRAASFFGDGLVGHFSSAEPACGVMSRELLAAAKSAGVALHSGKTYACVEGPRLGTRAESFFLRGAGAHLVGMTNVPEAFLAREAQLCYVTIAVATDYDCWMDDPNQHAGVDAIMAMYRESLGKVKRVVAAYLAAPHAARDCACTRALEGALLTPHEFITPAKRELLAVLRG